MKSKIHELQKNMKFVSKKFIFSAVALMAFSFAGMANEIEETKIDLKALLNCDNCYAHADSLDDGSDRTNQEWMKNVDACRTSNGCEAEFSNLIKKKTISIN